MTLGESDKVNSYFGMRKIECRDGFFYLNGKCVFQRLVLDQGFYPDGIYTAATEEDLIKDIKSAIKSDDMMLIKQEADRVAALLGDGATTDLKGERINIKTLQIEEKEISDNRYSEQNILYLLSTALSDAAAAMAKY